VEPELLARVYNDVVQANPKDLPPTSDGNIVSRRSIMVNFDPVRASTISTTDEEKAASYKCMQAAKAYLEARRFTGLVVADSGNGYHLLISIILPTVMRRATW
jgi:hypothetical protein